MKLWFLFLSAVSASFAFLPPSFLEEQKKFERVRAAIKEKEATLTTRLKALGTTPSDMHMLLIAYKNSDELELYVKKKTETAYKKMETYKVCARSGELGPKRKQGDGQVPEGFYHIDRFNPSSSFHLSLGVNYPNLSDKRKSTATNLGGDIFIHGSCVTIGCLPMTDDKIKELYLLAVYAKNNGQAKIPVYILPFPMTEANINAHDGDNPALKAFWTNLKTGYDNFQKDKKELKFSVDAKGNYTF